MMESAIVYTSAQDSQAAARELSAKVAKELPGDPPDALVLFASPRYDHPTLLRELTEACRQRLLVGASSAGEFAGDHRGEGIACGLALRSTEIRFSAGTYQFFGGFHNYTAVVRVLAA